MRILIMRDSNRKVVGFGLQWSKPLNLELTDRKGRRLGLLLNFQGAVDGDLALVGKAVDRMYVSVCERCKAKAAEVVCRSHSLVLCGECAISHMVDDGCSFAHEVIDSAERHV